jgi:hypothetical protein
VCTRIHIVVQRNIPLPVIEPWPPSPSTVTLHLIYFTSASIFKALMSLTAVFNDASREGIILTWQAALESRLRARRYNTGLRRGGPHGAGALSSSNTVVGRSRDLLARTAHLDAVTGPGLRVDSGLLYFELTCSWA